METQACCSREVTGSDDSAELVDWVGGTKCEETGRKTSHKKAMSEVQGKKERGEQR